MKANLGYYVQQINEIVQKIEETGDAMHPYFEKIRTAIDDDELSRLTQEEFQEIYINFTKGIEIYCDLQKKIIALRPPVKVIGIHKKFEKSFGVYIQGCRMMLESIDVEKQAVDIFLFNQSEEKQDGETDILAFCIQKMSKTVTK